MKEGKIIINFLRFRAGVTLTEIVLVVGVLALVIAIVLPLLFSTQENQIGQRGNFLVEQQGAMFLKIIEDRVRTAERIIAPAPQTTAKVLVLQSANPALDPILIGVKQGKLLVVHRGETDYLCSPQLALRDFRIRNTSVSPDRQSVNVSFVVERTVFTPRKYTYTREFITAFSLSPADTPVGNACGCPVPSCTSTNVYSWRTCSSPTVCDPTVNTETFTCP